MPAATSNLPAPAGSPRSERWLALSVWGLLLVLLWTAACAAPLGAWNPPRLAAAFALAAGQPLYPDPASGAQLGWIYGPGFALWLLPVTLIPSPSWALAAAILYNGTGLLAAIAWVLHPAGLTGMRLAITTGFAGLLLFAGGPSSQSWLTQVHVDTPCLIFCLLAIGATARFERTAKPGWLHVAAITAIAAGLTKQTTAPLPVVMLLYWLWRRQWMVAGRWVGCLGIYATVALAGFILCFDFNNALHYLIYFHRANPWKSLVMGGSSYPVVLQGLLLDVAIGLGLWALILVWPRRTDQPPDGPAAVVCCGLFWSGILLLPFGIVAAFKAGGGLNTAHGLLLLLLAVVVRAAGTPFTIRQRACGLAFFAMLSLLIARDRLHHWRPSSYQDELLALAKAHREAAYFPWNPLITLMSDGRVYPFEDALYCLKLAYGRPPPPERLRAALPARLLIIYDPIALTRDAGRYLPGVNPVSIYTLWPSMERYRP